MFVSVSYTLATDLELVHNCQAAEPAHITGILCLQMPLAGSEVKMFNAAEYSPVRNREYLSSISPDIEGARPVAV